MMNPKAEALSLEIMNVIREHRAKDPNLHFSDALFALALAKASLSEEFGMFRAPAVLVALLLLLASIGVSFLVIQ